MPEDVGKTDNQPPRKPSLLRRILTYFYDGDRPTEISPSLLARVFFLVGIYILPKGKGRVTIGRRFFRILMLVPCAAFLFLLAFYEYSTSPRFCVSCHIMKPYYEAWKTSRHNKIACVSCHYPPGTMSQLMVKFQAMSQVAKYITRTYSSKPYAEIEDASCLREGCHSERLLAGKVTFKRRIHFDHTPHLLQMRRGKKLRCTSCHSQIVVGNHIEVTEDTCFLCHFKGTKHGREENPIGGCPMCHKEPRGNIKIGNYTYNHKHFTEELKVPCQKCHLDAVRGEGAAPRDRCIVCHNEPWKLKKYGDTTFIHENHVSKRKLECSRCHEPIEHKLQKRRYVLMEGDCSQCHLNKHTGQRDLFMGVAGKGSPEIPGHMFLVKVECVACHITPTTPAESQRFKGQTFSASESACTSCHDGMYKGMVRDWISTFDGMIKEISPKKTALAGLLQTEGLDASARNKAALLYRDANYNIDLVSVGKGVHNPFYAAELLQVANRNLELAAQILGKKIPHGNGRGLLQGRYCGALCHQKTGVTVPEKAAYDGITFPHRLHAEKIAPGCTTCHSPLRHKKLLESRKLCGECHHRQDKPSCSRCHGEESSLFEGRWPTTAGTSGPPSPHRKVMDCVGCHTFGEKKTRFDVLEKCILCHDASYRKLADTIDEESGRLRATLTDLAGKLELKNASSPAVKDVLAKVRKEEAAIRRISNIHNPRVFKENVERLIDEARGALKR
jgi:nitrate/TMAO reductase-like tetraheme cytochrome c subunit